MSFTVRDTDDSGLCGRCEHATVLRGDRLADHVILCNWFHPALALQRLVRTCTVYQPLNTLDKHEMERIGWVLEVKGGRVVGFKPPKREGGTET